MLQTLEAPHGKGPPAALPTDSKVCSRQPALGVSRVEMSERCFDLLTIRCDPVHLATPCNMSQTLTHNYLVLHPAFHSSHSSIPYQPLAILALKLLHSFVSCCSCCCALASDLHYQLGNIRLIDESTFVLEGSKEHRPGPRSLGSPHHFSPARSLSCLALFYTQGKILATTLHILLIERPF